GPAGVHVVWGAADVGFAGWVVESRAPLRPALAAVWRARKAGVEPELPPETIERCLAVLAELGLDPDEPAAGKVDLERSATYRAAVEQLAQAETQLRGLAVSPAV